MIVKKLVLANTIKQKILKDADKRINFTNYVREKYSKNESNTHKYLQKKNYFFIVGMPRSGSTLVESIISQNNDVFDLGETEALPYSYKIWLQNQKKESLIDIYNKKINVDLIDTQNITDKNLANYSLVFLILNQIKNSRIIHCRNPLTIFYNLQANLPAVIHTLIFNRCFSIIKFTKNNAQL